MLNFVKIIILFVLIKLICADEALKFTTEKDFFDFFEKWTKSEGADEFRTELSKFAKHLMKTSVDPCEDFYEFSCGNFQSILPEDDENGKYHQTSDINFYFSNHLFDRVITADITEDDNIGLHVKLKKLYKSCMNDTAWEPEIVRDFLTNFTKWPILSDEWEKNDFSWWNVTRSRPLYGFSVIFRHNKLDTTNSAFKPLWPDTIDIGELKKASKALLINLDGKEDQLHDVVEFMLKLKALTKVEPIKGEKKFYTVFEMLESYPNLKILWYLQILNYRENGTDFLFPVSENFPHLEELLAETDMKTIVNFIFFHMILVLIPRPNMFPHSERSPACIEVAKTGFYFSYADWFANTYLEEKTRFEIATFVRAIQDVAFEHFKDTNRDEEVYLKRQKLAKIYKLQQSTFYPLSVNVTEFFLEKHEIITMDPEDFYTNFLRIVKVASYQSQKYMQPTLFVRDKFIWLPMEDGILVPITLLLPPFYQKYAPEYMKHGALGTYIARQFFKEVADNRSNYTRSMQCLMSRNYMLGESNTCAATDGLELALIAYKSWMAKDDRNRESTDVEANGKLLDGIQGLFLSYAQSICLETEEHVRKQISEAFSSLPEFRKAFSCD